MFRLMSFTIRSPTLLSTVNMEFYMFTISSGSSLSHGGSWVVLP